MAGFFSKKQYAAIANKELAMKLLKERCLECFRQKDSTDNSRTDMLHSCRKTGVTHALGDNVSNNTTFL